MINTDQQTPTELFWEFAVQEAAYAVIAVLCDVSIHSISLNDPATYEENEIGGMVSMDTEYADFKDRIQFNLAGSEAAKLYLGIENPHGCLSSYIEANRAIECMIYRWLDLRGEASGEMIEDLSEKLLELFSEGVRSLLSDPSVKRAVETLTGMLIERRHIPGDEAEEVIQFFLKDLSPASYRSYLKFNLKVLSTLQSAAQEAIELSLEGVLHPKR